MCKLIIGMQKQDNTDLFSAIYAQRNLLKGELDGIGGMSVMKDGSVNIYRDMDDYDLIIGNVLRDVAESRLVVLHSRTSTGGEHSLLNVHLFRHGNWVFAHNGFVSAYSRWGAYQGYDRQVSTQPPMGFNTYHKVDKYDSIAMNEIERKQLERQFDALNYKLTNCRKCISSKSGCCQKHKNLLKKIDNISEKLWGISGVEYATEDGDIEYGDMQTSLSLVNKDGTKSQIQEIENKLCDSFQFLNSLPDKLTKEKLESKVEEDGFSGMGFLFNTKTLEGFVIVKKTCYALTDIENTYSLFCSFDPATTFKMDYPNKNLFGIDVEGEYDFRTLDVKKLSIINSIYNIKAEVEPQSNKK